MKESEGGVMPRPPSWRLREVLAPPLVIHASELPLYFVRLNVGARGGFWAFDHVRGSAVRHACEVRGRARVGRYECLEVRVATSDASGRILAERLVYASLTERGPTTFLHLVHRPGAPVSIVGPALEGEVRPAFPPRIRTGQVDDLTEGRWVARRACELVVGDNPISCAEVLRMHFRSRGRVLDRLYIRPDGTQLLWERCCDLGELERRGVAVEPDSGAPAKQLQHYTESQCSFWVVQGSWALSLIEDQTSS